LALCPSVGWTLREKPVLQKRFKFYNNENNPLLHEITGVRDMGQRGFNHLNSP